MSILKGIFEGFRRASLYSNDPYRVTEVNADDYVLHEPVYRDDCLVLYRTTENDLCHHDVVMQIHINHSSKKAYSLHRTTNEDDAQVFFCQLREKLPLLVDSVPDLGTSKLNLQDVTQVIRDNPTWTAAHIAAHFGYVGCFKNNVILSQINKTCEVTLETPLHVAVKAQQMNSVTTLINLGAKIDTVDANGDTVLHIAAVTTKEIIKALTAVPVASIINVKNTKGCTPLHLACMADKPDCAIELLKSGADVNLACVVDQHEPNLLSVLDSPSRSMKEVVDTYPHQFYTDDIKFGGTPLHWSKTPELMDALIEYGCNVDARNFQGDTALHVMVRHNRLSCAVMLLSHNANVDVQGSGGNTPLHIAVKNGDLTLIHALVAFGANVNIANSKGETARHIVATEKKSGYAEIMYALHLVGAKRCSRNLNACDEGCSSSGHFNGIPPENCPSSRKNELLDELLNSMVGMPATKKQKCSCENSENNDKLQRCRVLSLDGGGIRGLVIIQLLDELEKVLGVPVVHCFDWVAGTSTGGILALMLACGKSVKESRCIYFRLKDKVFVGSRPYDAEPLEAILKKEFGSTSVMADIKHPRVMITATRSDRRPADLHIFRNYDSPLNILNHEEVDPLRDNTPVTKPEEQLIWLAARATGAAPTYFRALGPYLDGGLIANNPTLDAITEIHQCNQALQAVGQEDKMFNITAVVSLGTGKIPVVPADQIDVFRPDSFIAACRMAFGIPALGQLLVDQATQTDGRVIARAQAVCSMLGIPYYRLNPQLTENVALNDTDTKTLVKMLWETVAYMHSMREELEILATLLRP